MSYIAVGKDLYVLNMFDKIGEALTTRQSRRAASAWREATFRFVAASCDPDWMELGWRVGIVRANGQAAFQREAA